jgi:hypothetical protein
MPGAPENRSEPDENSNSAGPPIPSLPKPPDIIHMVPGGAMMAPPRLLGHPSLAPFQPRRLANGFPSRGPAPLRAQSQAVGGVEDLEAALNLIASLDLRRAALLG